MRWYRMHKDQEDKIIFKTCQANPTSLIIFQVQLSVSQVMNDFLGLKSLYNLILKKLVNIICILTLKHAAESYIILPSSKAVCVDSFEGDKRQSYYTTRSLKLKIIAQSNCKCSSKNQLHPLSHGSIDIDLKEIPLESEAQRRGCVTRKPPITPLTSII